MEVMITNYLATLLSGGQVCECSGLCINVHEVLARLQVHGVL